MINVFAFQSNLGQELGTLLSYEQNSQSKKLKDNIFNDLEYCIPLLKRAFQCPPGLKSFSPTDIENVKNLEAKKWLLFGNVGKNICAGVGLQLHNDLIEIECTALFCVREEPLEVEQFGELDIVFAYLRAFGTFIQSSGTDLAWMKSKCFGENTVKQVLVYSTMRRALESHEDTYLALHIMFIQSC